MQDYSVGAELERKTIEELQRVVWELESGKINKSEAKQALMSVWNVSSGLVSTETMGFVSLAQKEVNEQFDAGVMDETRISVCQDRINIALRRRQAVVYVTVPCDVSKLSSKIMIDNNVENPCMVAKNKMQILRNALQHQKRAY